MAVITHVDAAEKALSELDFKRISFSRDGGTFSAGTYWPNGDVGRDRYCGGHDITLAGAIEKMNEKVRAAEAEGVILTTAAECKAAVLDLIREHDAAPASFRDAVDALPVKP